MKDKLQQALIAMAMLMVAKEGFAMVKIDMVAIAKLESGNNPSAYNKRTKATGLFQITPVCLKDYNRFAKVRYTMREMKDPIKNEIVARWYLKHRVVHMLEWCGLPVTVIGPVRNSNLHMMPYRIARRTLISIVVNFALITELIVWIPCHTYPLASRL